MAHIPDFDVGESKCLQTGDFCCLISCLDLDGFPQDVKLMGAEGEVGPETAFLSGDAAIRLEAEMTD